MIIAATTVGSKRSAENEGQNEERFKAGERALAKAAKLGANIIVFPGGFFFANSAQAREAIAKNFIDSAKQIGIAIVFGVDQKVKDPSTDEGVLCKGFKLPYYGYAWSPSEAIPYCWAQRSSTSENQWYALDKWCDEMHFLKIREENLGVLMCGEIFNQRIRHTLANNLVEPKVVVDVAHIGGRFRVWQGMKALAALGVASVCSVHAKCEYAVKYCYVPPGKRLSTRVPDDYVYGPPKIELKLWTF